MTNVQTKLGQWRDFKDDKTQSQSTGVHLYLSSRLNCVHFTVKSMHFILSIPVTSKLYSSKFVWDVTNNMDIIRKYVECASFWCEFHHHCLFCLGDMGDRNLPRFTSFIIIVNFKAGLLQIYMGCHQQCEDHLKVHGKGFILV